MAEPWMLDELAHAGPEHLDADFVAGFDRKQGHPPVDEDIAILRAQGALTSDSTVVDFGAGTGRFALAAAAYGGRVVAVDVSPAMLAHVERAATHAGLSNLECVRAGFLSYVHAGDPAEAVFTRNALHQLPDFWKGIALARVRAVLRPGGVLRLHDLIYDLAPEEAPGVLAGWMDGGADDPSLGYTREDFATHVRTEFSTYRWLLEPLIEAAGFEITTADVRGKIYAAYTCMAR